MPLPRWIFPALCGVLMLGARPAPAGDDPLFPIKQSGKWGFINAAGKIVIPPKYDDIDHSFSEGLAAVQVGKKWGYIDRSDKLIIPPQFDSAQPFQHGLAAVRIGEPVAGEGKWGYIDPSGNFRIKPDERLDYTGFSCGVMPFRSQDKWGYINVAGDVVIQPRYRDAGPFRENLASVEADDANGFIDPAGKLIIRLVHAKPSYTGFRQGLAAVIDQSTSRVGYIDKTGRYAIACQYAEAREFCDDRAAVCIKTDDATGWPIRKWGFIDRSGTLVIPARYKHVFDFSEGLARVISDDDKSGFIDRDGKQVIPCKYDGAESFQNGLASVRVGDLSEDGWSGYIDKAGRFVYRPPDYQKLDQARAAREQAQRNRIPSIRLFTDPRAAGKGLLITCSNKVTSAGPRAGQVAITIANLLEEEVFVQVSGYDKVGGAFESIDGGFYCGGESFVLLEYQSLYQRLKAPVRRDGRPLVCGCCIVRIHSHLPAELMELGRSRGHIDFRVSGFYRNNGKEFYESVELPVEIAQWPDDAQLLKPAACPP